MDVSPTMLREAEFRIALRGYSCEEVDQFLETAASGLEGMQERLRQAVERAQRAESAAASAPPPPPPPPPPAPVDTSASDETLRKTLVLAQRTADLAVQEAREQAARILSAAESQAQARLTEAEERARRTHEDALSDIRAELTSLEVTRQRAQQEVDALHSWVEDHRSEIMGALAEALGHVERVGVRSPVPSSRPIDLPPLPRPGPAAGPSGPAPTPAPPVASPPAPAPPAGPPPQPQGPPPGGPQPSGPPPSGGPQPGGPPSPVGPGPSPAGPPRQPGPPPGGPSAGPEPARQPTPTVRVAPASPPDPDSGPPTQAWRLPPGAGDEVDPTPGQGIPPVDDAIDLDEEDQAFEDFFDDEHGEDAALQERRFGGRLRRRR